MNDLLGYLFDGEDSDDDSDDDPYGIPDDVENPVVVPAPLLDFARNTNLAELYDTICEYANLTLSRHRDMREHGFIGISTTDAQVIALKGYTSNPSAWAAELMDEMLRAREEVLRPPNELVNVLNFLSIPWPPIAINATTAGSVAAATNVVGDGIIANGEVYVTETEVYLESRGFGINIYGGKGFLGVALGARGGAIPYGFGDQFPALPVPDEAQKVWPA